MPDVTATNKRLPFKRTVPRKKIIETINSNDNGDNDAGFFNRPAGSFLEVFEQRQRALDQEKKKAASCANIVAGQIRHTGRRKVPGGRSSDDECGLKRPGSSRSLPGSREISIPLSPDAPTRPKILSLDSDPDDVVMDVKGKDRAVAWDSLLRTPRKAMPSASTSKSHMNLGDDNKGNDDTFGTPSKRLRLTPSALASSKKRTRVSTIEILSDDDEHAGASKKSLAKHEPDTDGNEIPGTVAGATDPPDEFAEYIRKARERRAQAKRVKDNKIVARNASAPADAAPTPATDGGASESDDRDSKIFILMTSRMDGTKPVKVLRKLTQDMHLPLETWMHVQREQQGFQIPDDLAAELVLTWKGNVIYRNTSAAGLGVEIDALGQLRVPMPGGSGLAVPPASAEEGFIRGGVVLEVWTPDVYAAYQAAKDREHLRNLGELDDDDVYGQALTANQASVDGRAGLHGLEPTTGQDANAKGIKVTLKAKDLDPFKITAHSYTQVGLLISAFRMKRIIPEGRDVALYFDGERLEESMALEEVDLDPDETNMLEVHIK